MAQLCPVARYYIAATLVVGMLAGYFYYLKKFDWSFGEHSDTVDLEDLEFKNYLVKFNKSYSGSEYHRRLDIFKASLAEISTLNALERHAVFGLTKFSDMSDEELADYFSIGNVNGECTARSRTCRQQTQKTHTRNTKRYWDNLSIPDKFDWRKEGYVSPIVEQKLCFGCWAISLVGVMETMAALANISRVPLSIQELMDCSTYNNRCTNGSVYLALEFICDYDLGIVTADKYPLTLKDGKCNIPSGDAITVRHYDYKCLVDETDILRLVVHHGPVTTIVNAAPWLNYIGGIIRRACVRNEHAANHAVQIVGYDLTGAIPYYIVKNSWGTVFGEDGYVRVALYENVCGIREEIGVIDVIQTRV